MAGLPHKKWRKAARLAVVSLMLALASLAPASAQDVLSDFFGGLFGGGSHRQNAPSPRYQGERVRRLAPSREDRWREPKPRTPATKRAAPKRAADSAEKAEPSEKTAGEKAAAEKIAVSFYVATIGDTLGMLLADGLDEAFEDRPEIGVLHKGKESSGLVRADFYDWPMAARELAAGPPKIDMAVMMIGGNDRQSITENGATFEPFTERWNALYAARVDAVIAAFGEKKIPLVWVGLPVMKSQRFSADMAKLNQIYRERAAHAGVTYVDLWEAFGDERGNYRAFGPDINGEIVKLRAGDGVHFTEAGARNLALFVEKEIKREFEARFPQGAAPGASAPPPPTPPQAGASPAVPGRETAAAPVFLPPGGAPPAAAPALPERPPIGPVQALTVSVSGQELARRSPAAHAAPDPSSAAAQALADHLFKEGRDLPVKSNRADDFSWRGVR